MATSVLDRLLLQTELGLYAWSFNLLKNQCNPNYLCSTGEKIYKSKHVECQIENKVKSGKLKI